MSSNYYTVRIDEECGATTIQTRMVVNPATTWKGIDGIRNIMDNYGPTRYTIAPEDAVDCIATDPGRPVVITVGNVGVSPLRVWGVTLYNTDDLPANVMLRILDFIATM